MYRGFNLQLTLSDDLEYYKIGKNIFADQKKYVEANLGKFLLPNKSLNGTGIQESWFPEIDAHIFLSHSHVDERTALILAGWLNEQFQLNTFIDSSVWGYANDLLKIIDNTYCLNPSGETYSYNKRNYSTSHVHMMLATALNKMIDKCECVFFLNTPHSVSSNAETEMTASPWIYMEIATTKTIRKETPERIKRKAKAFLKGEVLNERLMIEYELELAHLQELSFDSLANLQYNDYLSPEEVLDDLYAVKPIDNKFYK